MHQSTYLDHDFQIPQTLDNESLLHACLGKRLNPAIQDKTIKNYSNTQKAESLNRTLLGSLPRNVAFTKNFLVGRTVLRTLRVTGLVTLYLVCVADILTGGSVDKALEEMQKAHEMDRIYHTSVSYKRQIKSINAQLFTR